MAMDNFSYTDSIRAAFASCLPCFTTSPCAESASTPSSTPANPTLTEPRSTSTPRPSSNDLEHLLRDSDSDALSLHSNLGAAAHRRARRRRRPKFSLTLFGYTLFGRPPIYLFDDDEDGDGGRARVLGTASSSTLDSDAAPLDASTIERLTSPDHFAALAAQRESERRRLEAEEETRRKAERRARRQERKTRERAAALMSLTGGTQSPSDVDTFEGFQGSGDGPVPSPFSLHQALDVASQCHLDSDRLRGGELDDGEDADLGGELYTRRKKSAAALSASGSDSRSRTSASFSAEDTFHIQNLPVHTANQSIPYPHTEMHLPVPVKTKPQRAPKRTSTVSSQTSQSTSTAPYTPVESITETPAVAAFPVPHERYIRDGERVDFPSAGLSGARSKSLDPKAFLAHQG
ncbi:hypothetical protein JVU11DRAFT_8174 [Chiua virens]|nr:hypothetical protein JVU11DRAFT_8174 [Chiua virens]